MLDIAVSGLRAFQRSIETTSHNISNVNTEGYSRQRVELDATMPQHTRGGYLGTGVKVDNIARVYDQFVNGQLRSSTSAFGEVDHYKSYASQVDNLLADADTGMEPAIQGYFNAVNDVANDPSSVAVREVMLSEAQSLSHRFSTVGGRLGEIRSQVNSDLKTMTKTINSYTAGIADLNKRISADLGRVNGQKEPNDLMDERDLLLKKLSELVDVSVIPQDSGMVSVVMSNGQSIVMDGITAKLGMQQNEFDPTKLEITYVPDGKQPQVITSQVTGGKLGGALRFGQEILDPTQQKLGAVTAAIAMETNAVHEMGYDLDGNAGQPFFKFKGVTEVPAMAVSTNTSTATVKAAFNNINTNPTGASSADLDTSDYLLKYDGTNYTLTRMSDESEMALTASAGAPMVLTPTNPVDKLPGITLEIDSVPAVDDEFFIRPTFQAVNNLTLNVTDPSKIAAATNLDSDGLTVLPGAMPGDNRNALNLAALANKSSMFGGSSSFQESYGQVVAKVGGLTHSAKISATAQESLLERANEARENISGVNLDEEAANLIKFQQSYQAAAKAISTASSLFDSILGAVR
jgi:flagellar hook-associated protein 1 FlgK